MYRKLSAPLFVQVEVTTRCTQACTHCYNYWRQKELSHHTLTIAEADEIIRQLVEAKIFRAVITGGEPLLVPDVALYLVEKLAKAGVRVHLNSNLVPLDDALATAVAESNVYSVLTSLMSYKPETHDGIAHLNGAWSKTIAGIRRLLDKGIAPGINMVVSTLNYTDVYETGKFVARLTGRSFTATKAICPATGIDFPYRLTREQARETMRILLRLRRETGLFVDALEHYAYCLIGDLAAFPRLTKRRCSAGVTSCTIGADGTIRPCSHAPLTYGNVFDDGFLAAWDSMKEWRDGSIIPQKCQSCRYLNQCSGGCRVEALVVNGSLDAMDPYATSEEDVTSLPERQLPPANFSQTVLSVNEPLARRKEIYGTVVSGGGGRGEVTFINEETDQFLQMLIGRGPTEVGALKEAYQLDDKSTGFLWSLLERDVLKTAQENLNADERR